MQVTKVAWDAASTTLAVACLDDTCTLWQKQDASWKRRMVLRSKAGRFTCMRFLPADHAIITGASPYPCCCPLVIARLTPSEKGVALCTVFAVQGQQEVCCRNGIPCLRPSVLACEVSRAHGHSDGPA